ncbi:MAG: hypothetical protein ACI4VL_01115 [Bacilli bacterium]
MAYISDKMDENKIQFLANEMTRTYMANKTTLSSDDFMKEYYRFYNASKQYIASEENKMMESELDNNSKYISF